MTYAPPVESVWTTVVPYWKRPPFGSFMTPLSDDCDFVAPIVANMAAPDVSSRIVFAKDDTPSVDKAADASASSRIVFAKEDTPSVDKAADASASSRSVFAKSDTPIADKAELMLPE